MRDILIERADEIVHIGVPSDLNSIDMKVKDIDYLRGLIENKSQWTCLKCFSVNPKLTDDE